MFRLIKLVAFLAFGASLVNASISNSVIGTPKVECHEDVVSLDIVTDEPFKGNIFVKGKAKDPACTRHFDTNGNSYASYSMQLGRCGMQRLRSANPRGMNFAITVIISFHEKFITKYDRAFHIRCFYMEPDEVVSSSLEVSALPTTVLTHKMDMPTCEYSVRRDSPNGPVVTFANVGDTVFHVWDCHGPDMGMMVKKCFVTDGKGEDHAVIDSDGCSTDTLLLTELTYDIDLMKAHAQSQVFKYADSNQLYFTCQIRLCQKQMGLCQGVTPPRCSASGDFNEDSRPENSTKRSSTGHHRTKRAASPVISSASPIISSKRLTEVESVANETGAMLESGGRSIDWSNVEIDVASDEMTIVDLDKQISAVDSARSNSRLEANTNGDWLSDHERSSDQLCIGTLATVVSSFAILLLMLLTAAVTMIACKSRETLKAAKLLTLPHISQHKV